MFTSNPKEFANTVQQQAKAILTTK
jgi:hypothetical protein